MALNESKGNMYDFVTHTWNTVKGECPHKCSYCYMMRWGKLNSPRLDEKEFRTDLGKDNFIFVGSSNDLFAENHPEEWILKTLDYCDKFENEYLFQSKNPGRIIKYLSHPVFKRAKICTTLETNFFDSDVMNNAPRPEARVEAMEYISQFVDTYITIEPIMFFEPSILIHMVQRCNPKQVNIGANSGNIKLCEPATERILLLIEELSKFTKVKKKSNLTRLLNKTLFDLN